MGQRGSLLSGFSLRLRRALSLGGGIFFDNPDLPLVVGDLSWYLFNAVSVFFSSPRGTGGLLFVFLLSLFLGVIGLFSLPLKIKTFDPYTKRMQMRCITFLTGICALFF